MSADVVGDTVSVCRVMQRYPEARKELRRATVRGTAREGVLQLARGLRSVARVRTQGLPTAALPSKAQLGGMHIPNVR